jgi:hypothetical protein
MRFIRIEKTLKRIYNQPHSKKARENCRKQHFEESFACNLILLLCALYNNAFGFMHHEKDQQLERRISIENYFIAEWWTLSRILRFSAITQHAKNYNSRKL